MPKEKTLEEKLESPAAIAGSGWPRRRNSTERARLLCHLFEQQELAVTCIYEDAVQVPELPLDRGEHRVEVGEIADVCANGETSGSKRLPGRLQRPFIQAADGDARALSVEFLRCGQPDPAIAAGDKDILVR